jgi:hypothetical protein
MKIDFLLQFSARASELLHTQGGLAYYHIKTTFEFGQCHAIEHRELKKLDNPSVLLILIQSNFCPEDATA